MSNFIFPVVVLAGLAIVWAVILAYSAKKFRVERDDRIDHILHLLPGANCGACGFPGCEGYAEAVALKDASLTACRPGGKALADSLAVYLGKSAGEVQKKIAVVYCKGKKGIVTEKYNYTGVKKCSLVAGLYSGTKECPYACLGLGDCVVSCPFEAIEMGEGDIPKVDLEKCTGCGLCVIACPKKIIGLAPYSSEVKILCSSKDKGPVVKKYCKTGCIACGICVKICPKGAITMPDNLAVIDYSKCNNCGLCVEKCPVKVIVAGKLDAG